MDRRPPPPPPPPPVLSSPLSHLTMDHLLNKDSPPPSNHRHHLCPSSTELMKEIATLEVQILQLERYLLSLYRTAFRQHLPSLLETPERHLKDKTGSCLQRINTQPSCKANLDISYRSIGHCDSPIPSNAVASSDYQIQAASSSSTRREKKQANSGHRSLADHLGASYMDDILHYPDKLSGEIVICISSIYCKFSNHALPPEGLSLSSTSSLSSSSTFSPRDVSSSWSPQFSEDAKCNSDLDGLKDENTAYASAVEVSNLNLDDDSFKYVANMLQRFRSLVKSLEKVDPRKMKREEKLVFWLNIHNSLVMHAYLAYGTHNFVRSASILKAAYNVGGYCINAYVIQNTILGIRSHYSAPWLQTLLSPRKRAVAGSMDHPFAIEYPEPLVHFALSSGSFYDPVVRVYTASNVFQDLKVARDEFIRANAYIHKEKKIHLPKIVSYYARDMSLSMNKLLEVVWNCLPELQQKTVTARMQNRPDKHIYWVPQSSSFRYLIHKEVTQEIHLPLIKMVG